MSDISVEKIANGIFRIRDAAVSEKLSLTERYGILKVSTEESTDEAYFEAGEGTLRFSEDKVLRVSFRPDSDDEFWSDAVEFVHEKFKDRHLNQVVAEGNPNTYKDSDTETPPALSVSDVHFGACFEVKENERFYGLGEASRDKLELRGRAYQNWTYYQFDEMPIPYLMSSDGWGLLVNASGRNFADICEQHDNKLIVSGENDPLDIFVFYGTMPEMLKSYAKLTGKTMVLPGWAYGLTYIAPIHADQFEVMRQAERFRENKIPCDMISLEPGWQSKFYDFSTEPQWNLEKFHVPTWLMAKGRNCPDTFISALRRMGFHLSLWFCDDYDLTDEAERQFRGDDNNKFEPWYKHLAPFSNCGIDGFKLDPADMVWKCNPSMICSNGLPQMQMHNINQVLLTKQTYEGYANQTGLRPMHHYCGGYIGSQRWSACTTGDNGGQHGAMIWLLTLAMSGFSNSTIDMHIFSPESIHFGFLVPWAHLNAWEGIRQPWWAGEKMYSLFKFYARLRYRLFPYIYSAALEAHEEAMPMVRPMPLAFPDFEKGYDNTCQYMFGPYLMVCAYSDVVCLPQGSWENYWTGEIYSGPCEIKPHVPEDRGGALFVLRGAIIPACSNEMNCLEEIDKSVIELDIYPDAHSEYILREDDMTSLDYVDGTSCKTIISYDADSDSTKIHISDACGSYNGKPDSRKYIINIYGNSRNVSVVCDNPADKYEIIFKR